MNKLSIAACLLFLANSNAFVQRVNKPDSIATARLTMNAQGPAGSFFHKVPEGEDDEEAENSSSDLDDGLSEILRQRKKPPLASNPSTIKGVPTSKATGKSNFSTYQLVTLKHLVVQLSSLFATNRVW